jgi:hypothetical protein
VDTLTLFGLFAVSAMLACYALENCSHWFVLLFAVSCALGSAYGFLQGAWPFGLVEAILVSRCPSALARGFKTLNCTTLRLRRRGALLLNGRAGNRTVRTEHAAITRFRTQQRAATRAFVKKLAGVGWHDLGLHAATSQTSDRRFQSHRQHSRKHETEHDQNRAERQDARHESGDHRACARGTRCASRCAAATPEEHAATTRKANDGDS